MRCESLNDWSFYFPPILMWIDRHTQRVSFLFFLNQAIPLAFFSFVFLGMTNVICCLASLSNRKAGRGADGWGERMQPIKLDSELLKILKGIIHFPILILLIC